MLSIAHIPFLGGAFTGRICALAFAGREYRHVTYRGMRILTLTDVSFCLRQGGLLLELTIRRWTAGTRCWRRSAAA